MTSSTYPKYFVEKWMDKGGYDPGVAERNYRIYNNAFFVMLLLPMLGLSAIAGYAAIHQVSLPGPLFYLVCGMIILGMGSLLVIQFRRDSYQRRVNSFQREFNKVSSALGREAEQLVDVDDGALMNAANTRLKAMADYIQKVQVIEGSEAAATKEWLLSRFKAYHNNFFYWRLVPDAGWKTYFKN